MQSEIYVSVHWFKVHRPALHLFLRIYIFSFTVFCDRVPTHLTISVDLIIHIINIHF